MPKPKPDPPPAARVLRRQPRATAVVVREVTTVGGNKVDVCAQCNHMRTKLVTNQTTCDCCKKGHQA